MSNLLSYYKNDFYLVVFYFLAVIFAIQLQEYTPYISNHREMSIIEDLFICAFFAVCSLCITFIGLCHFNTDKLRTNILCKLFLGCYYGGCITIAMTYIADTSFLRHETFWRIIITSVLFDIAVYFSILYYVKFKVGQSILIIFIASLPFIYLFTR